ncbi:uncharacterized protein [Rutidosis leptorrhynchoides]|uniref:uncharacterized protein n=1 Tax=Rutidosis leptorrhynchoides TaxID=125765 RepID=UPI003A9976DF
MAQELADGEFWLPPEFLNDEDILMDFIPPKPISANNKSSALYGSDSFGSKSDLSSPVESLLGSTETESDEDEHLTGLTRKLGNTSLKNDLSNLNFESHISKSTRVMAGSPQSTLCGCMNGSSSRGSPNCVSPPLTVPEVNRNEPSWDLLYAAAGEVARMRMVEEAASRYYLNSQPPCKTTSNPNLRYQQLQVAQFQQLKQQQMAKQKQYLQMIEQHNRKRNENVNGRPLSTWPTQLHPGQRVSGSGMRAVFLGNSNTAKRETTGTGVFLPRQIGAPAEPIKKRGCSTVLLPDRVVQALNLNLKSKEGADVADSEMVFRNSGMMSQQGASNNRQQPAEFRLPQEWTY